MEVQTPIDIVNSALMRLGQLPITGFGEFIGSARIVQKTYEQELKALLRRIPWNFARIQTSLSLMQKLPPPLTLMADPDGAGSIMYTGAYAFPKTPQFLRLLQISPFDGHWRVVNDGDNNVVLYTDSVPYINTAFMLGLETLPGGYNPNGTDNAPPSGTNMPSNTVGIEYVAYVDSPAVWDALFTDAFVARLAYILSFGVTGLEQTRQDCRQEYQSALADASAVNGMEQYPDIWNDGKIQDVRFGYSGISFDGM